MFSSTVVTSGGVFAAAAASSLFWKSSGLPATVGATVTSCSLPGPAVYLSARSLNQERRDHPSSVIGCVRFAAGWLAAPPHATLRRPANPTVPAPNTAPRL